MISHWLFFCAFENSIAAKFIEASLFAVSFFFLSFFFLFVFCGCVFVTFLSLKIQAFVYLQELFDLERWGQLVMQFRRENFQLHQLNDQSALAVTLQAGLSALKTPYLLYLGFMEEYMYIDIEHVSWPCMTYTNTLYILAFYRIGFQFWSGWLVCPG